MKRTSFQNKVTKHRVCYDTECHGIVWEKSNIKIYIYLWKLIKK